MFAELRHDLRAWWDYAVIARHTFLIDEDEDGVWDALTARLDFPAAPTYDSIVRRLDVQRAVACLARLACTGLLVWKFPAWLGPTGPAGLLVIVALCIRYPRVPLPVALASAGAVGVASPSLAAVAILRVPVDWATAKAAMRLRPSADRRGRAGARALRREERRAFGETVAAKTEWAPEVQAQPEWHSARLEEQERTQVERTATMWRHAVALATSGIEGPDTEADLPARREVPPTRDDDAAPLAPVEPLRDAFGHARKAQKERELRADVAAILCASALAGAITLAHPASVDVLHKGIPDDVSDLRVACMLALATAVAVGYMRWNRPLKKKWWGVGVLALIAIPVAPPILVALPAVWLDTGAMYLRRARERSPYEAPRVRSLLTPRRINAVVDLWFARRRASNGFDVLAEQELVGLVGRFERLHLGLEAAQARLDLARIARQHGAFSDAALRVAEADRAGGAAAARAALERGLLASAMADPSSARHDLLEAARLAIEREDIRTLSRSLSALAALGLQDDEPGMERVVRAARSVALLRPADHRIVLENELTVHGVLMQAGRYEEAAQAADDVLNLVVADAGFVESSVTQRLTLTDDGLPIPEDLTVLARAALALGDAHAAMGDTGPAKEAYEGVLELLTDASMPLEEAEAHRRLGLLLEGQDPQDPAAFRSMLLAVAILTEQRHVLATQPDRARWFARHRAALEGAFRLAARHERSDIVLELVELARTQAVPHRFAAPSPGRPAEDEPRVQPGRGLEAEADERSIAREVIGALPLAPPPRLVVRGTSAIEELAGHRPAAGRSTVDLARAAVEAGGPGAWWLSYWVTESTLHWALLEPVGPPLAGRISLEPGAEARVALDDLEAALPMVLADEEPGSDAWAWRMELSPFADGADRQREAELSDRLGRALLPDALRHRLGRLERDERLPLVISPCSDLAHVPWCLLGVAGATSAPDLRLHDVADWRLAPHVALLDRLARRPAPPAAHPVAAAVLDPTSNLPAARMVAHLLPPEAVVLGGHWRRRGLATTSAFRTTMANLPAGSTLIVASHCVPSEGVGSLDGLVLLSDDAASTVTLTATDLLLDAPDHPAVTLPSRVVLAACDSAGVEAMRTGEWLSFGPAALLAGADVVATTQFPIPDSSVVETGVVVALRNGGTLADLLHAVVQDELDRWRAGEESAPLEWAAFALIGRWEPPAEGRS